MKYLVPILISFAFLLFFCSCSYNSSNKDADDKEEMANPAAVYCHEELGGDYIILEGEGGVCKLPNGEIIGHDRLVDMTTEWIKNRDPSN